MSEATKRQVEVLRFISGFYDANGYSPTRLEIATEFDINTNGAQCHVDMLKNKGLISVEPKTARSIVITSKGDTVISNVQPFIKEKQSHRPQAGELYARITKMIEEYDGELGTAEAIGVLEIVKHGLMRTT